MANERVLVMDDQPAALEYHWEELREAGYDLIVATTVEQAIFACNADFFDLLILDRMLPTEDVYTNAFDPNSKFLGDRFMLDARSRNHLRTVPVLFLTNYPRGEDIDRLTASHRRFEVIGKDTLPSELVIIVKRIVSGAPVEAEEPVIPDDEYPDVAPYYVTLSDTEETRVRAFYQRCSSGHIASEPDAANSDLGGIVHVLNTSLSDTDLRAGVRALTCHEEPDAGALGYFWIVPGAPGRPWYHNVWFLPTPWTYTGKHASAGISDIGAVLIARYLREWLWRQGLPQVISLSPAVFEGGKVQIEPWKSLRPTLDKLGIVYDVKTNLCTFSSEQAFELLDAVTVYKRSGRRDSPESQ